MIPNIVTQEALNQLAAPNERVTVRVVLRRIVNTAPYTVRGKRRRYTFRRDAELGAHILDVPLSLWMQGFPDGPYRENLSIAHDLQGNRTAAKSPLVFLVLDRGSDVGAEPHGEATNESLLAFRDLLTAMQAPPLVMEAFDTLSAELPTEQIVETIRGTTQRITGLVDETDPDPVPPTVTRDGNVFFLAGEKIGKINASGHLQMSKGKKQHRALVEAVLEEK